MFQKYFELNKEIIYLNSGTHSLAPSEVIECQRREHHRYEQNPTLGLHEAPKRLWEVQKALAKHFNADPAQIFLRANVTQPLNEFILGIRLPKDAEILTSNQEYGAVYNICQFRAERDGLPFKTFALPTRHEIAKITAEDIVQNILKAITPRTRMLVISDIYTGNGLVMPTLEIAKETRKRGIFLVVDAAHSLGSLPVDFAKFTNVDFYAGNLHKWWMGAKGSAIGWVHPDREKDLVPINAGWITYDLGEPFTELGDGDTFAVRMLMLGCHDFSIFYSLLETLKFWEKHGKETLLKEIHERGEFVCEKMRTEWPHPIYQSTDKRLQGPLYSFHAPKLEGSGSHWIRRILQETNVQVSVVFIDNEAFIRLSPHIYNTQEQITTAIGRLQRYR